MKPRLTFILLVVVPLTWCVGGCERASMSGSVGSVNGGTVSSVQPTLAAARNGFVTHLLINKKDPDPLPQPAPGYRLVYYTAPVGKLPALIATPAGPPMRRPAIVWITGGFDHSIDDTPWKPASPDNDQSGSAFPRMGVVTMYPAFRGGNNGPGYDETFYGEVNDAIAAADFLAKQPGVDPQRIYLGGHSTGGTLALLVAEYTNRFRAVFAFGAVGSVADYGSENATFDLNDRREVALRSPILYLGAIRSPTFVFEGTLSGNFAPLKEMCASCSNPHVHFYKLPGLDHFSELAPITPVIAAKIIQDTGSGPHFSFLSANPEIDPADR